MPDNDLELGWHEEVVLLEGGHSLVLGGHFHLHRVMQRCPLQLGNLGSQSPCQMPHRQFTQ